MKIDFIIGSLRSGGAERVVSILANYFVEKGHEVRIITFKEGDKYKLNNKIIRKRFHKDLPLFNFALVRAFVYLIRFYWFRINRPDVISSHIHLIGLVTIPIAKLYKIKIVVSEHTNHVSNKVTVAKWFLWNMLYKLPNAVTILTKFDQSFFESKNKSVFIIHNPCSFKPIKSLKTDREKTILAIGSLDNYVVKGFDNLLEIAKVVVGLHPDWKFMIVGDGVKGYNFLKEKINNMALNKNVVLTGYRSDIDKIMEGSSIFILTSRHEGLPMVLIEASSQGMACAAYDCISGPSEIIDDGRNGVLVKNQDKIDMTNQIIRLINNEKLRKNLGENAIKSIDKFAIDKIGGQWESLFNSIAK